MSFQSIYIFARQGEETLFTKAESHREAAKIFGEQLWEKRGYSEEEKITVSDSFVDLMFIVSKNMNTGYTEATPLDSEKESLVVLSQTMKILSMSMKKVTSLSIKVLGDHSMTSVAYFMKNIVAGLGKPMFEATENLQVTKSYLYVLDEYLSEYDTMKTKNSEEMVSWLERKAGES